MSVPRTEVVVEETATTVTKEISGGTLRVDKRLPPAPKPAPITADTMMRWSPEDFTRLRSSTFLRVQAGQVTEQQQPAGTDGQVVRSERNATGWDRDRVSND
jgi:hypothetical protein